MKDRSSVGAKRKRTAASFWYHFLGASSPSQECNYSQCPWRCPANPSFHVHLETTSFSKQCGGKKIENKEQLLSRARSFWGNWVMFSSDQLKRNCVFLHWHNTYVHVYMKLYAHEYMCTYIYSQINRCGLCICELPVKTPYFNVRYLVLIQILNDFDNIYDTMLKWLNNF